MEEVRVLLDEFGTTKLSIHKMDSQGEGQKVKEKGLQYALEQGENKVLSSHLEMTKQETYGAKRHEDLSKLYHSEPACKGIMNGLEVIYRGNMNLKDTKNFLDQIKGGDDSVYELNKQERMLKTEEEELQAAMEETEYALKQEEEKICKVQ